MGIKPIPEDMKMPQDQKDFFGITDEKEEFMWQCYLRERQRNRIIFILVMIIAVLILLLVLVR